MPHMSIVRINVSLFHTFRFVTPSSLVKVHRPALDPVERGGDGGVQSVDEAARRQDRRGLERDGRDGRALGKVAVQRAGGLIRLIERERIEQRVALLVRVAAVVQRAAGAREGRNVPVRRQAHLAEIQVKIPVLQRGQIVAPRE